MTSDRQSEVLPPTSHRATYQRSRAGVSVIRIASWIALILGAVSSINVFDGELVIAAVACGGIFVTATSFLRVETFERAGIPLYVISLMGAVLTVAAVTLTGNLASPFLLLAMMPSLFAAMVGGYRIGLTTAFLSAALIAGVAASSQGWTVLLSAAGTLGLFPLVALVVAQIRSLLTEAEERVKSLAQTTEAVEAELALLGHANQLLRRLTDLYGEGNTNPIDVGRRVIEAIVDAHPGSFATATLFDTQGPVVVARGGTDSPRLHRSQFPLGDGGITSGVVSIATPEPLTPDTRSEIERLLRPVAVSFANALLLQQIAGEAVREERFRLARELHDEVGPALAALGLALDSIKYQRQESDGEEILRVREGLQDVVTDLRGIIADLRADRDGSMSQAITSAVSGYRPPPTVEVDIHETRSPYGATERQIVAVVTEAVRNAYRHGDAASIRVKGSIDRNSVELEITDDGRGFDPGNLPHGHYGVMGMRERAERIGASLDLRSDGSGTSVRLTWKDDR